MTPEPLVVLVALVPLLGATLNGLFGARFSKTAVTVIGLAPILAAFAGSVVLASTIARSDTEIRTELFTWIAAGALEVGFALVFDRLAALMCLLLTSLAAWIHLYSAGSMRDDPAYPRYTACLNLSSSAMLLLVLADSLPLLFVGWQGLGGCTALLVGFWFDEDAHARASRKAFVANRIGDFGMLVAMMVLFRGTGTLTLAAIDVAAVGLSPSVATAAALLLFLGAASKSALIPLYVWLPDSTTAPRPATALLQSVLTVAAGVYLLTRTGSLLNAAPVAMSTVALLGALTALVAAAVACAQSDLSKMLAYSTVSQLGFTFVAVGVGAMGVALLHLVVHGFAKACLFLGADSVIRATGEERDMRRMGGLRLSMPWTHGSVLLVTLVLSGFPLSAGFISSELILWNAWGATLSESSVGRAGYVLWGSGIVASATSAFALWRGFFLVFWSGAPRGEGAASAQESSRTQLAPLVALGLLAVAVGGLAWPGLLGGREWLVREWLEPVLGAAPISLPAPHVATRWALFLAAAAASLGGFFLALGFYARGVHPLLTRLASEEPGKWLHARLHNAWHLDALYETVLLQPIWGGSKLVLYRVVERVIIEGIVTGVARLLAGLGFFLQLFHSGNIQRYLAIFAISVAILLYGWLAPYRPLPPEADTPTLEEER